MDKKKIAQIVLLLIFAMLMVIAGCNMLGRMNEKKAREGIISVSGRIEGDEYNAGSKVTGKVEKIVVEEGQEVKKGDLIGSIFSEQLRAQLDSAAREIEIAKNKILQAEAALQEAQSTTDAQIDQSLAGLTVQRSQLNTAHAQHQQSLAEKERSKLLVETARIDYDQACASLKKARATLDYNEKEYTRYKNLMQEDAIARTTFDSVETQYIVALEDYKLARKEVDKARAGIENSRKTVNVASANVEIAQAGIIQGQSNVEAGKANVKLARVGVYSIEQREKDVKTAHQMLERAKDAWRAARADLEDAKVYAPINGTVVSKIVEPGEVIAGGTPLATIVDMDALYLRVFVPTDTAGKLRIGNPATIIPDAFDGNGGREKKEYEGSVYQISRKAEFTPKNVETKEQRAKQVFSVKIRVKDNRERLIKPGMPCEAQINTAAEK